MSFREKSPREKCPREKGLLGRNVRIPIVPCMSILSGILQTKFGPAKVKFILVMGQ